MTEKHSPCILWRGSIDSHGYGRNSKRKLAHRVEWEKKNGAIPPGMVIDHLCRCRSCINTDHMEVVTPGENTIRGYSPWAINKRKTLCLRGHELSGENLLTAKDGRRRCRTCSYERWNGYRARAIAAGTFRKKTNPEPVS